MQIERRRLLRQHGERDYAEATASEPQIASPAWRRTGSSTPSWVLLMAGSSHPGLSRGQSCPVPAPYLRRGRLRMRSFGKGMIGGMGLRRVGVEEELLLVDPETGVPRSVSSTALRAVDLDSGDDDPGVEQELFLQQIETANVPSATLADLAVEIRRGRQAAASSAEAAGVATAAMATPVIAGDVAVTPNGRYQRMVERFGSVAREQMVCGMHVHVEVADDEEGIGAFDRIRPWLPVLLAISANSPFWDRSDTGLASFRSQVWSRWPSAGATEPFGDAASYRSAVDDLISSQAALDPGMIYFDARLAQSYPTLEIRVADVCTAVQDAVLVAALARSLVETGAQAWLDGAPVPPWRSELLRGAAWQAARFGLAGDLMHPRARELRPADEVVAALLEYVGEALDAAGDMDDVRRLVGELRARGTGSARQRAAFHASGRYEDVVRDVVRRTRESIG